jgi:hypothetical protein
MGELEAELGLTPPNNRVNGGPTQTTATSGSAGH